MEFENNNTFQDENLLSDLSKQTPQKDEFFEVPNTDSFQVPNTNSFQVSPSFQYSQNKQGLNNAESMTFHNYQDQQYKNNEPSFSLNNQSIKQDFCCFQQIYENLAKIEQDLNNQSIHESFSDIKSNLQELQDKYQQFVINVSDQVVEFQNQQLPYNSGSKHKRTRSEAPPSITKFNVKTKKNETSNLIEKSFDTNIFQKQSEEYSLLLDIINQDIQNIENTKFQDYDQSMELIVHYYRLREMYQSQIVEKDNIIQNFQDTNAQLNFTIQEYQQNFDDLLSNFNFDIKNFNNQSKDEQVSLAIQKIQELIQQNQQYEQDQTIHQQEFQEQLEVQNELIKKIEELQNSLDSLVEQYQLLSEEKTNQDKIIDSLKQQIQILQQKSQGDQINSLCQYSRELIQYLLDFIILSNKLLQHIYNQSGVKLQFPDYKHFSEISLTLQGLLQNKDIINFKNITENLITYSQEIEVLKKQICLKYQLLVEQIIRQRQQLMESLQI